MKPLSTAPLFFLVILIAIGSFLKTLSGSFGIPDFIPAIRDPLILYLFLRSTPHLKIFESKSWALLIALLTIFIAAYIIISLAKDSLLISLYYLRVYLIPLFFFIAALGIFETNNNNEAAKKIISFMTKWNCFLFLSAILIFISIEIQPSLRRQLFGTESLQSAWFVAGGTWMRMGLPASGPNTLGLMFALNAFFFTCIISSNAYKKLYPEKSDRIILVSLSLSLIGLIPTASRSSAIFYIFATFFLIATLGKLNFKKILYILAGTIGALILVALSGLALDEYSNGSLSRWIFLTLDKKDPSMDGHLATFSDAYKNLEDYFALGYPRGTVGPLAMLFSLEIFNVENSFLGIFYDMGLILGIIYIFSIVVLYTIGFKAKTQSVIALSFCIPCMLLPYIFELTAMMYFGFVYLATGFISIKPANLQLDLGIKNIGKLTAAVQ